MPIKVPFEIAQKAIYRIQLNRQMAWVSETILIHFVIFSHLTSSKFLIAMLRPFRVDYAIIIVAQRYKVAAKILISMRKLHIINS